MYIWDYGFYTVYFRVFDMISALFAFFSFVILFVFLIHKKLNYILRLENELAILEGGNLQYPITIQATMSLPAWPKASTICAVPSSSASRGRRRPSGPIMPDHRHVP